MSKDQRRLEVLKWWETWSSIRMLPINIPRSLPTKIYFFTISAIKSFNIDPEILREKTSNLLFSLNITFYSPQQLHGFFGRTYKSKFYPLKKNENGTFELQQPFSFYFEGHYEPLSAHFLALEFSFQEHGANQEYVGHLPNLWGMVRLEYLDQGYQVASLSIGSPRLLYHDKRDTQKAGECFYELREAPALAKIGNLIPSYVLIGSDEFIPGIEGNILPFLYTQLSSVQKMKTVDLKVTEFEVLIPRDLHDTVVDQLKQHTDNLLAKIHWEEFTISAVFHNTWKEVNTGGFSNRYPLTRRNKLIEKNNQIFCPYVIDQDIVIAGIFSGSPKTLLAFQLEYTIKLKNGKLIELVLGIFALRGDNAAIWDSGNFELSPFIREGRMPHLSLDKKPVLDISLGRIMSLRGKCTVNTAPVKQVKQIKLERMGVTYTQISHRTDDLSERHGGDDRHRIDISDHREVLEGLEELARFQETTQKRTERKEFLPLKGEQLESEIKKLERAIATFNAPASTKEVKQQYAVASRHDEDNLLEEDDDKARRIMLEKWIAREELPPKGPSAESKQTVMRTAIESFYKRLTYDNHQITKFLQSRLNKVSFKFFALKNILLGSPYPSTQLHMSFLNYQGVESHVMPLEKQILKDYFLFKRPYIFNYQADGHAHMQTHIKDFLVTGNLYLEFWDASSGLMIGTSKIPLKSLVSNAMLTAPTPFLCEAEVFNPFSLHRSFIIQFEFSLEIASQSFYDADPPRLLTGKTVSISKDGGTKKIINNEAYGHYRTLSRIRDREQYNYSNGDEGVSLVRALESEQKDFKQHLSQQKELRNKSRPQLLYQSIAQSMRTTLLNLDVRFAQSYFFTLTYENMTDNDQDLQLVYEDVRNRRKTSRKDLQLLSNPEEIQIALSSDEEATNSSLADVNIERPSVYVQRNKVVLLPFRFLYFGKSDKNERRLHLPKSLEVKHKTLRVVLTDKQGNIVHIYQIVFRIKPLQYSKNINLYELQDQHRCLFSLYLIDDLELSLSANFLATYRKIHPIKLTYPQARIVGYEGNKMTFEIDLPKSGNLLEFLILIYDDKHFRKLELAALVKVHLLRGMQIETKPGHPSRTTLQLQGTGQTSAFFRSSHPHLVDFADFSNPFVLSNGINVSVPIQLRSFTPFDGPILISCVELNGEKPLQTWLIRLKVTHMSTEKDNEYSDVIEDCTFHLQNHESQLKLYQTANPIKSDLSSGDFIASLADSYTLISRLNSILLTPQTNTRVASILYEYLSRLVKAHRICTTYAMILKFTQITGESRLDAFYKHAEIHKTIFSHLLCNLCFDYVSLQVELEHYQVNNSKLSQKPLFVQIIEEFIQISNILLELLEISEVNSTKEGRLVFNVYQGASYILPGLAAQANANILKQIDEDLVKFSQESNSFSPTISSILFAFANLLKKSYIQYQNEISLQVENRPFNMLFGLQKQREDNQDIVEAVNNLTERVDNMLHKIEDCLHHEGHYVYDTHELEDNMREVEDCAKDAHSRTTAENPFLLVQYKALLAIDYKLMLVQTLDVFTTHLKSPLIAEYLDTHAGIRIDLELKKGQESGLGILHNLPFDADTVNNIVSHCINEGAETTTELQDHLSLLSRYLEAIRFFVEREGGALDIFSSEAVTRLNEMASYRNELSVSPHKLVDHQDLYKGKYTKALADLEKLADIIINYGSVKYSWIEELTKQLSCTTKLKKTINEYSDIITGYLEGRYKSEDGLAKVCKDMADCAVNLQGVLGAFEGFFKLKFQPNELIKLVRIDTAEQIIEKTNVKGMLNVLTAAQDKKSLALPSEISQAEQDFLKIIHSLKAN